MTWIKYFFLAFTSCSFGLLSAAGVFTVLVAVGLVPRFAGKTHTGKKVILYEEMVIAGTSIGGVVSIFENNSQLGNWVLRLGVAENAWQIGGSTLLGIYGLFGGMFIGCLALAIAEMLDSIPIFSRRIGFRHGMGIAVCAMAAGKIFGSVVYFVLQMGVYNQSK